MYKTYKTNLFSNMNLDPNTRGPRVWPLFVHYVAAVGLHIAPWLRLRDTGGNSAALENYKHGWGGGLGREKTRVFSRGRAVEWPLYPGTATAVDSDPSLLQTLFPENSLSPLM